MGTSAPTGAGNDGVCKYGGKAAEVAVCPLGIGPHGSIVRHRRGRCPHRPANNHRTDRRRVKDAAPYGGDGHPFDIQGAAARG